MQIDLNRYHVRLATTEDEKAAAQRLRYRVFVEEMGAHATAEEHELRREWDVFDPYCEHLILEDLGYAGRDPLDKVVGVYRLMRDDAARAGKGYYGNSEYDLQPIIQCGRPSVELGRSCIAKDHRGGPALHLLWDRLAQYILTNKIEILFGVASFPGVEPEPFQEALAWLHHNHLAPVDLRCRAWPASFLAMDLMPTSQIEPARAVRSIPSLIKAYLRLGGKVGEGAFIDHTFNAIDVWLVIDILKMPERYHALYARNNRNIP